MILAAHQPNYLPWAGTFHKILSADLFVLLDHVQFEKGGLTNCNAVKGPGGRVRMTVPVVTAGRLGQAVRDVEISGSLPWRRKHWNTLLTGYARAPHFEEHRPFFEALYAREWTRLAELNEEIILYLMGVFGIDRPVVRSSELAPEGAASEMLVALCRRTGASGYLSGKGARAYTDEEAFRSAGLSLAYQRFRHPVYPQMHGPFVPNLSAADLLLNTGPEAGAILAAAGDPPEAAGAAPPGGTLAARRAGARPDAGKEE